MHCCVNKSLATLFPMQYLADSPVGMRSLKRLPVRVPSNRPRAQTRGERGSRCSPGSLGSVVLPKFLHLSRPIAHLEIEGVGEGC